MFEQKVVTIFLWIFILLMLTNNSTLASNSLIYITDNINFNLIAKLLKQARY